MYFCLNWEQNMDNANFHQKKNYCNLHQLGYTHIFTCCKITNDFQISQNIDRGRENVEKTQNQIM